MITLKNWSLQTECNLTAAYRLTQYHSSLFPPNQYRIIHLLLTALLRVTGCVGAYPSKNTGHHHRAHHSRRQYMLEKKQVILTIHGCRWRVQVREGTALLSWTTFSQTSAGTRMCYRAAAISEAKQCKSMQDTTQDAHDEDDRWRGVKRIHGV